MTIAGLWRYGDWRHVATGCNTLFYIYEGIARSARTWCGQVLLGQEDVTGWSGFRGQDETGGIRKKTETEEGKEEDEGNERGKEYGTNTGCRVGKE